jgi:peptidyl-prolyl cis-trans isomerase SurA
MKFIKNIALLLFTSFQLSGQTIIDRVVALVGDELILLSDIEEQYAFMKENNPKLGSDARCNIIDQLLVNKLLLNQSKIDSIEVSDDEVEEQMNARIEQILGYMNNDVRQFEDYYGQTINQVKSQMRDDLKNQLLTERMRSKIFSEVKITPAEVKAFFDKIHKDSLPYFNSEVEIGEIVMKPKVNEEEKKRAVDLLTEIRRKIVEDGESFSALAQKFSDDGSGRNGGDLGWTKRGNFVPEFEAAAYKLEKEEISPIVESEFGFHLIQMLGRRGNSIHTRHILIRPSIQPDDIQKVIDKLEEIRQDITSDSISFSLAVKRYSDKDQQSTNNDGRMINPITGNTFFEIGDLDPDVYFIIDKLKLKEISKPFEFEGPRGEILVRIVQLQSLTAPHKASLEQDYAKIRKATIDSKKSAYISNYVQNKVENTYIKIDESFSSCPTLYKWNKESVKP